MAPGVPEYILATGDDEEPVEDRLEFNVYSLLKNDDFVFFGPECNKECSLLRTVVNYLMLPSQSSQQQSWIQWVLFDVCNYGYLTKVRRI